MKGPYVLVNRDMLNQLLRKERWEAHRLSRALDRACGIIRGACIVVDGASAPVEVHRATILDAIDTEN